MIYMNKFIPFLLVVTMLFISGCVTEKKICNESETKKCGVGVGVCKQGVQTCTNNQWSDCADQIQPTRELCGDNLDNNCDGNIDESCEGLDDYNIFVNPTLTTPNQSFWFIQKVQQTV